MDMHPHLEKVAKSCPNGNTTSGGECIYADVLSNLSVGVIVVDRLNGQLLFENTAARQFLESETEPHDPERICRLFQLKAADSRSTAQQHSLRLGERIIGYTIYDTAGRYDWILLRDVTDKLRLEAIAEAVNTMDSIGYVFTGIRHEIGNPINSTKITLSVLRSNLDKYTRAQVLEYIDRALGEIDRVGDLLRSLKAFNMYETPKLQEIEVSAFIEKFIDLVRDDFQKNGIDIHTIIHPEARLVCTDARALQQVLLNIMANASDALDGREEPRIIISAFRMDGRVVFRVVDNGCGITEKQLKDLFKPFHTTKASGSGLGLVIVKKALARMNGSIEITSEVHAGTIVDIALPANCREDA